MSEQSTDVVEVSGDAAVTASLGEAVRHPSPRQYVLIAVVLFVVTAFEVTASYLKGDVDSNLLIVAMLAMAAVKFFLVAAWYMHLKTDRPMLRRFFMGGVAAAVLLYFFMLLTFSVFSE